MVASGGGDAELEAIINRSDEMRPEWFDINAGEDMGGIPYSKMWDDDR